MGEIFLLIFLALCIGTGAWLLFIWAVRNGQYEDIEGPKYRMLDDDIPRRQTGRVGSKVSTGEPSDDLDSPKKPASVPPPKA
ncbi:MAG TPA: cbb3-type cytochrome oxidase assembly protein CcoS [Rectinemataceae bacterium]|nr:cbb3-type cytochrome oxidase assembly protein CcoS [Rectinemataceae bacterium]